MNPKCQEEKVFICMCINIPWELCEGGMVLPHPLLGPWGLGQSVTSTQEALGQYLLNG